MAIWETIVGGLAFEVIRRQFFPDAPGSGAGLPGQQGQQGAAHAHTPAEIQAAQARQRQVLEAQNAKAWRAHVPLDRNIPPTIAEEVYSAIEEAPPEALDALSMNALRMGYPVSAMHLAQCAVLRRQAAVEPLQPQRPQGPSLYGNGGNGEAQGYDGRYDDPNADPEQLALNRKHAGLIRKQVELNKLTPEERMAVAERERLANLQAVQAVMTEQERAIRAADPTNPALKIAADLAVSAVVAGQEKAVPRFIDAAQETHDFNQVLEHAQANGRSAKSVEVIANTPAEQHSNGEVATS